MNCVWDCSCTVYAIANDVIVVVVNCVWDCSCDVGRVFYCC